MARIIYVLPLSAAALALLPGRPAHDLSTANWAKLAAQTNMLDTRSPKDIARDDELHFVFIKTHEYDYTKSKTEPQHNRVYTIKTYVDDRKQHMARALNDDFRWGKWKQCLEISENTEWKTLAADLDDWVRDPTHLRCVVASYDRDVNEKRTETDDERNQLLVDGMAVIHERVNSTVLEQIHGTTLGDVSPDDLALVEVFTMRKGTELQKRFLNVGLLLAILMVTFVFTLEACFKDCSIFTPGFWDPDGAPRPPVVGFERSVAWNQTGLL